MQEQEQCWDCGRIGHKSAECTVYMVGDVEQEAGVDAVNCLREEPWLPEEGRWWRPKQVGHEKARFTQGYGGPLKISTGCVEECSVNEEWRSPMERTRGARVPRRSEVTVKKQVQTTSPQ